MAEMQNFHVLGADDGLPRGEDETSSRGIEFSVMLYYMGWGESPDEHKHGYWATASDGTPAARPNAMMPEDCPIHSTSTGRVLRDKRRQTELDKREGEYEILTAEARKAPDPWLTAVIKVHHRHPLILSIILLNSILFSGMYLEILADEDWRLM